MAFKVEIKDGYGWRMVLSTPSLRAAKNYYHVKSSKLNIGAIRIVDKDNGDIVCRFDILKDRRDPE